MPSSQGVEESLGVLQVGGVKALGEPAVDVTKDLPCCVALALTLPKSSETGRDSQF
jgi:hypothetical protein